MIFKVFKNISAKQTALPHMSKAKRKYYAVSRKIFVKLLVYYILIQD